MITYLLKFVVCTGVLYAFYYLVLRNQRLFRFNRFFMLSTVVLSALIPFVIVRTKVVEFTTEQAAASPASALVGQSPTTDSVAGSLQLPGWRELLVGTYLILTAFLLFRLIMNLWSLNRFKKGGKIVESNRLKLVLRSDISESFSFMKYMFTNKEQYKSGQLPKEVIAHEKAHIDQRHSYDILFIEFITCICWFNPFVYLLKRAIQLNHEFLADEAAIAETGSLVQYQNIIIQFASRQIAVTPALASHLSFGETKKRIKIMVKTQNKQHDLIRQISSIGVISVLFIFLGNTKTIAQVQPTPTTVGLTPSEIIVQQVKDKQDPKEKKQAAKLRFPKTSLTPDSRVRYTDINGKDVQTLFKELSPRLQQDFKSGKLKGQVSAPLPKKLTISPKLIEEYKDASKYRIRIDGNPNRNGVLNKFSADDFHHYFKHLVSEEGEPEIYRISLITNKLYNSINHKDFKIAEVWLTYYPDN